MDCRLPSLSKPLQDTPRQCSATYTEELELDLSHSCHRKAMDTCSYKKCVRVPGLNKHAFWRGHALQQGCNAAHTHIRCPPADPGPKLNASSLHYRPLERSGFEQQLEVHSELQYREAFRHSSAHLRQSKQRSINWLTFTSYITLMTSSKYPKIHGPYKSWDAHPRCTSPRSLRITICFTPHA
jgi:hypothetical protein